MITIALLWNNKKNWDYNEQTALSAQKNAIFSSQRFYGLKKELREETQLYALKSLNVFITAFPSTNNKGRQGITTNEKPKYFRLKSNTKTTNKQQ